jgi:isoquinoline 1-oxidoreductase subunit alpha
MTQLTINRTLHTIAATPDTPLLWVLREELGLTGTKFGCGVAACGACTVHINGAAVRSCVVAVGDVAGQAVTTIEGLAFDAGTAGGLHALQAAWISQQVPQCGYCQAGMLMAASALLAENAAPSAAQIDGALSNICRCGTYPRIRAALQSVIAAGTAAPSEGVR